MNLETAARLWQRFLAGETLDPRDERQLLEALDKDSALRASLLADARIHGLLASARSEPESRALVAEVKRLLEAQDDGTAFVDRFRRRLEATSPRRRFPFRPLLAAAVLLVAVVLWLVARPSRPGSEPSAPLAERRPPPSVPVKAPAPERAPDPLPPTLPGPVAPEKPPSTPIEPPEPPSPAPRQTEFLPVPAPAPGPAPAPLPEPSVPPPAGRTEVAAAVVESVRGEAAVRQAGKRRAPTPGMALHRTDLLETVGAASAVVVRLPDQTRVELWGDSVLVRIDPPHLPERRIVLEKGSIGVEAPPQGLARALVFETPEAEAWVVGTAFQLATGVEGALLTRLDVDEGKVKLTRRADSRAVEVTGGQFAVAAQGVELRVQRQADHRRTKNAAYPGVDVKKVDLAIDRGVRFLKSAPSSGYGNRIADCDELLLLTFAHAGVSSTDGRYRELLQKTLTAPLERTYKVALQAMVLEEIDRVKHQRRIAQCGQFLVDSQCGTGQWSYGSPAAFLDSIPEPTPVRGPVSTSGARPARKPSGKGMDRVKPEVVNRIVLRKNADGPGNGDNSNAQYAALGLRACAEAGVVIPRETLERARKWWIGAQQARDAKGERKAVASGAGGGAPGGWCYGGADHGHAPYGSMTAGAVGAMVIYDHLLGLPWKKDETVLRGLAWMSLHYSVTANPGPAEWDPESPGYMLYYYLYAVERAGILTGLEKLGDHPWYATGARSILAAQAADGSWKSQALEADATWDTCFAILFLTRATSPLEDVATVDRMMEK